MLSVSAHEEYSGGFDQVIKKKKRNVDDCRHTYSTLAMLTSIYSSTYTRVPVPYIYIQNHALCTLKM